MDAFADHLEELNFDTAYLLILGVLKLTGIVVYESNRLVDAALLKLQIKIALVNSRLEIFEVELLG